MNFNHKNGGQEINLYMVSPSNARTQPSANDSFEYCSIIVTN